MCIALYCTAFNGCFPENGQCCLLLRVIENGNMFRKIRLVQQETVMTSTDGWIELACLVSSSLLALCLFPQMTEPDFAVTFNMSLIEEKYVVFIYSSVKDDCVTL